MYAQIVLFDGFDPLDVIAPYEVLVAGSDYLGGELAVELVSAEGPRTVVSGSRGLPLQATARLDPARPGFVIVPGAVGPLDGDPDEVATIPVLLARFGDTEAVPLIRAALDNPAVTVATVCGGSLALAMAGLSTAGTPPHIISASTCWRRPAPSRCRPGWSTTAIWSPRAG